MSTRDAPLLYVAGFGACTPVGRSVWASAAAARAGLCGFSEHPFMVDTAGEPMRIARAPWIGIDVEGVDRCAALLLPAIDEAMAAWVAQGAHATRRPGLALALPPHRPGRPLALAEALLARIEAHCPGRFGPALAFEAGHAAAYLALDAAARSCAAGSIDACMVCAVDSYLAPETLEWIEACDQLHGGGPLNNAWGFVPGEAASAALVGTERFMRQCGAVPMAEVLTVGIGHEDRRIKTDTVCIGEGLTQALRAALDALAPGERVDNVFCDMNGEAYRADEYGFAVLRTGDGFRAATDFVAPADCWGDVGAAGAPLHMSMAAIGQLKRYGRGPLSVTWASSESGERGAVLMRAGAAPAHGE